MRRRRLRFLPQIRDHLYSYKHGESYIQKVKVVVTSATVAKKRFSLSPKISRYPMIPEQQNAKVARI